MALDSAGLQNLFLLFPELHKEFEIFCEDALRKVAKSGFQESKERVIIAEAFFNEMPGLAENDRRRLIALIEDAGGSRTLNTCLRDQNIFTQNLLSWLKEWASKTLNEAVRRSKDTKDQEFLAVLPGKVSEEPLLEPLAQHVMKEAHRYYRDFIKQRLCRLYLHAHEIKQRAMHRQVELGVDEQDQKRRVSLRNDWFNEIKVAQAQPDPGYVSCCL